jgi:hypothetical protein
VTSANLTRCVTDAGGAEAGDRCSHASKGPFRTFNDYFGDGAATRSIGVVG